MYIHHIEYPDGNGHLMMLILYEMYKITSFHTQLRCKRNFVIKMRIQW